MMVVEMMMMMFDTWIREEEGDWKGGRVMGD